MVLTHLHTLSCAYSHPEATRLTTMEEEVDELWTSTVTKIPTTSPATGLDSTTLSWKMSPATLPGLICSPHTHRDKHAYTHMQTTGLRHGRVAKSNIKQDSKCLFPQIQKGHRWGCAVNYTALPQWDIVNCSAVTHLYVKHQLAESLSTR